MLRPVNGLDTVSKAVLFCAVLFSVAVSVGHAQTAPRQMQGSGVISCSEVPGFVGMGEVVVGFTIGVDGIPLDAHVVYSELDNTDVQRSAIAAAYKYRYVPATDWKGTAVPYSGGESFQVDCRRVPLADRFKRKQRALRMLEVARPPKVIPNSVGASCPASSEGGGEVYVRILIDTDGVPLVSALPESTASPSLIANVLQEVSQFRFSPALDYLGRPVSFYGILPISVDHCRPFLYRPTPQYAAAPPPPPSPSVQPATQPPQHTFDSAAYWAYIAACTDASPVVCQGKANLAARGYPVPNDNNNSSPWDLLLFQRLLFPRLDQAGNPVQ